MQTQIKINRKVVHENVKRVGGRPDKLTGLIEHLTVLKEDKFTGYIKVNYSQGSIGRIEKFEEILKRTGE